MAHRISAGALVHKEGSILLVRYHQPGKHDYWVAPGGGVIGEEDLKNTARREVEEETGLLIRPQRLAYIEELLGGETRHVKFWFHAELLGGVLTTASPEAMSEGITEAAWLSREQLNGKIVFPPVLTSRYWEDRGSSGAPIHLELRRMEYV
jgi:8-oxo-dGTP diphosphatase